MSLEVEILSEEKLKERKVSEKILRSLARRVMVPCVAVVAFLGGVSESKEGILTFGTSIAEAETGGYPQAYAYCYPRHSDSDPINGRCMDYDWREPTRDINGNITGWPTVTSRGFWARNCTDWAAYRVKQATGVSVPYGQGMGSAIDWDTNGVKAGYVVDDNPEPGDIAQRDFAPADYGHVGVVEKINRNTDGSILSIEVSEYNSTGTGIYSYKTYFKNSSGGFSDWDDFIDVNGEGVGINGEALPGSMALPEERSDGDPFGNIDRIRRYPGGLSIDGWVMDPDTIDPIGGQIYTGDGFAKPEQFKGGFEANLWREDLIPIGNGNYHGFRYDFLLNPAEHNICLYGINRAGAGKNRRVDCAVRTFSGDTVGNFEALFRTPGGITAKGWAFDPDTDNPINVHLFSSEVADPTVQVGGPLADDPRQDVIDNLSSQYVGFDKYKGFEFAFPIGGGNQKICAFAVNSGSTPGDSTKIGCKEVYVSFDPKGWFDSAIRVTGGVALKGWALDPDTKDTIGVRFYGGTSTSQPYYMGGVGANLSRPDIVPSNPGYGSLHGFSTTVPLPAGVTRICAHGINAPGTQGANKLIGCRNV